MMVKPRDAKKLFLKQQGLLGKNGFGRGANGTANAIGQLSYVQIDTISVVNRAHEHVLTNRVPGFKSSHLDALLSERRVFEYWSHAAAFLPFEHYRFALPVMAGWRESRERDEKLARKILARISAEGPLQSRHFEDSEKKQRGGWWEWKPAKRVLEHLFLSGELMVSHREGFQKVFDLPERIIPDNVDTTTPTIAQWCEHMAMTMINALGVANELDLGYARSTVRQLAKITLKQPFQDAIERLVEDGKLVRFEMLGQTYYSTNALISQLPLRVNRGPVKLLSPFDNLVINRKRTSNLFGFDYLLECYLPEAKRQYGYFSLPMLYGDELIGRADIKADRKHQVLIIRNLALEDHIPIDELLLGAISEGLVLFATQHQSGSINIERTQPTGLKNQLIQQLKNTWNLS